MFWSGCCGVYAEIGCTVIRTTRHISHARRGIYAIARLFGQHRPAPHLSLALARLSALLRQPPVYCTADADADAGRSSADD